MIFSRDRILTTHVGSLPRNEKLSDLLMAQEEGKPHDPKVLTDEMDKAVRHVVAQQMAAGIDVGNDGEQRRIGFQTYVPQRMSGFAGVSKRRRGKEFEEFPEITVDRITGGLNVGIGENLMVKAEYLVNRELQGAPPVANNVATSSVVWTW